MSDFDDLAAPARRALAGAGINSLAALVKRSATEVMKLHGMGPNALAKLRVKLKANNKSFKKG